MSTKLTTFLVSSYSAFILQSHVYYCDIIIFRHEFIRLWPCLLPAPSFLCSQLGTWSSSLIPSLLLPWQKHRLLVSMFPIYFTQNQHLQSHPYLCKCYGIIPYISIIHMSVYTWIYQTFFSIYQFMEPNLILWQRFHILLS